MITVKISPVGGYIVGDGNIPSGLDPDQFMKLFMARIIRARAQGLKELEFTDEEIEAVITAQTDACMRMFDEAAVQRFRNNTNVTKLIEACGVQE